MQDIDIVNNTIMGAPAGARAVAADLGGVDPATVFSDPPMNIWNIAAGTIVTAQPAADALAAATLPSKGTHLQGIQQVRCTLCLCVAKGVYSKDKGEEAGSARGEKLYLSVAYGVCMKSGRLPVPRVQQAVQEHNHRPDLKHPRQRRSSNSG